MKFWFLSSPILIFSNQQFYSSKKYIYVTEEGEEESLFVLSESVAPAASSGGIGTLSVDVNNHTDSAEANNAPILLLGRTSNIRLEDMVELCRQGIAINGDNKPEPENFSRQGETTAGTVNWRREVIIYPRKAGNLQNYFASFRLYSHY